MKVFITGATGLIGSVVSRHLLKANHTVLGLARNDEAVKKLTSLGIEPIRGDLFTLDVLTSTAKQVDAVIHCGYDHAAAFKGKTVEACVTDRNAISALCDGLVESSKGTQGETKKVFLNSGFLLGNNEEDEWSTQYENTHMPREEADKLVNSYGKKGIKAVNMRLSPVTYGTPNPHPFISGQVAEAKKIGKVRYVESGENIWSVCDVESAAELYVLALTSDIPQGACLNLVTAEYTTKEIAVHIAKKMGLEATSMTKEEAMKLGFVGMVLTIGKHVTTDLTKKWTGWEPKPQEGFWEHVDATYFN